MLYIKKLIYLVILKIINLNPEDLNYLAKSLGLTRNNINNVINILQFMNKLKLSELDFEINTDLYDNLLIRSDFKTIIKLLKANPSLVKQISKLFYEILINNKNRYTSINDINAYYEETYEFVKSLIDLKHFDIMENILLIISEEDTFNYINLLKLFIERRFPTKYFKYFKGDLNDPYILAAFLSNVKKAANSSHHSNQSGQIIYVISKIMEIALNIKNLKMFDEINKYLILDALREKNGKFYGSFFGSVFEINEEERRKLLILIETKNYSQIYNKY